MRRLHSSGVPDRRGEPPARLRPTFARRGRPRGNGCVTICPTRFRFPPPLPVRAARLHRRFRYHAWATARLAAALPDASAAVRPLAHALTADRVWWLRLRGEPTEGVALWPALDADGCRALARRNAEAWDAALRPDGEPLGDDALDAPTDYANSRGERFDTAVGDVLEHVLLHAAYHRGQAAAALRAEGVGPPATDFVVWLRLGEPDPPAPAPPTDLP